MRKRCWSSQLQRLLVFDVRLPLLISEFPGFSSYPSHPFAVLCSDLVREIIAAYPPDPDLPALRMSFKFYYCNKSALCWLFSALCDSDYFQVPPGPFGTGGWGRGCARGALVLETVSWQKNCSRSTLPCWPLWGVGGWSVCIFTGEGIIREPLPPLLAHRQSFFEYVFWVERSAGFSGVTKRWEMQPALRK